MALISVNPATGLEVARFDEMTDNEVEACMSRACEAWRQHARTSFSQRREKMLEAARLLGERARRLGEMATREMGKPIRQAEAEVHKCAAACEHYAIHAERYLAPEIIESDAHRSYVAYQPLGPVLAIMPWNFPYWQVFRFAVPALMAGNTGLLKHASNVTGCAMLIEEVLHDAGFDQGEFQTLRMSSGRVESLIGDDRVRAVTLTGSEGAGREVGRAAGQYLKPVVLELGGSDAYIVLEDADLEHAVETGVTSRMQNNAQSCIAAKRFIIEAPVYDAFVEAYVHRVEAMKIGDPMSDETDLGPLVRSEACDEVHEQVRRTVEAGARLLTGGHRIDRPGFYYAPTVLAEVKPGMVSFEEEVFGPVASMIRAENREHAVELANTSRFGLGGAVFTRDPMKGEAVALQLEVGCAFVNAMVRSDPRLPFGGIKVSGVGRELSHHGIREFVNIKTIWIA